MVETGESKVGCGRITSLEAQKRRPHRVNVHLDGVYAFSLEASVALSAGLRCGDPLDEAAVSALLRQEEHESARARALRFLVTRERSRFEVQSRLEKYGYEPSVVDGVVAWLMDLGYVEDARFARLYWHEKAAGGWGPARIAAELLQRGIPRELTAAIMEEDLEGGGPSRCDDADLAALVRRRFRCDRTRDPAGARRRAHAFLARRGHGWERIERVLELAFATDG